MNDRTPEVPPECGRSYIKTDNSSLYLCAKRTAKSTHRHIFVRSYEIHTGMRRFLPLAAFVRFSKCNDEIPDCLFKAFDHDSSALIRLRYVCGVMCSRSLKLFMK